MWAVGACRQGRVRGSLEALSGPREGSEGNRDSCWTLCECRCWQLGLVDRGGLGAAWRPSRGREKDQRRVGILAGPFVSAILDSSGFWRGQVRGSLEALLGQREGSEGSGNSSFTTCELR